MATKLSDQMITELKQHFSMTSFASINAEDESFTEEDTEPTEELGALID
jgi:hypothetical protein